MQKKKLEKAQKKNTENIKAKGLGDTVEKVFKKTGIDKVAKFILGEDCGCDKRKDKLNELFPYNKPECLNEDEFNYLDTYFKSSSNVVTTETQDKLLVIYNIIKEADIVKNKDSGNVYPVQKHNKKTQTLIKKDASKEDELGLI